MISKFVKGAGIVKCELCGKNTRPTQSINIHYCEECFELLEGENEK